MPLAQIQTPIASNPEKSGSDFSDDAINQPAPPEKLPSPHTRETLLAQLQAWGIGCQTHEHPQVFTVAQGQELHAGLPGAPTKNLFVKDRTGKYWLISAAATARIDLVLLGRLLGAKGRLSFGSADQLFGLLGVLPGAVTAFALLNDGARRVRFVLDGALLAAPLIQFHPLRNDATTCISPADLRVFLQRLGAEWDCVSFLDDEGPQWWKMD